MFRLLTISAFLLFYIIGHAQETDQQKKQREKFQKEMEKKQDEAISNFVNELEADAFTKEIITQRLHSYAQKRKEIYTQQLREVQRKEKIDYLNDNHFASLKSMASPEVMNQIQDFINMTPTEMKKREKSKRKRKRKKKNDSIN